MSSYNNNFNEAKKLHALGKIKEAQKLYEETVKNKNDDYMKVLKNTLNSERVKKITDDDKTIAFLLKTD